MGTDTEGRNEAIRGRRRAGATFRQIAGEFGMTQSNVYAICRSVTTMIPEPAARPPPSQRPPGEACIHHWIIKPSNGSPSSPGECQKCGAVAEFANSFERLDQWFRTKGEPGE